MCFEIKDLEFYYRDVDLNYGMSIISFQFDFLMYSLLDVFITFIICVCKKIKIHLEICVIERVLGT